MVLSRAGLGGLRSRRNTFAAARRILSATRVSPFMSRKIVTVTGGSGFVGQILRRGLRARGYEVRVFDRYRSLLVTFLNRRYLGTVNNSVGQRIARRVRCAQR